MLNLWEREEIICFLRNWKRLIVCKGSWIHSSHSRMVGRLTGLLFFILPSPGGPEKRLREPPHIGPARQGQLCWGMRSSRSHRDLLCWAVKDLL